MCLMMADLVGEDKGDHEQLEFRSHPASLQVLAKAERCIELYFGRAPMSSLLPLSP